MKRLALARSAARGRRLAALLDPDTPVPGVTTGILRPEEVRGFTKTARRIAAILAATA